MSEYAVQRGAGMATSTEFAPPTTGVEAVELDMAIPRHCESVDRYSRIRNVSSRFTSAPFLNVAADVVANQRYSQGPRAGMSPYSAISYLLAVSVRTLAARRGPHRGRAYPHHGDPLASARYPPRRSDAAHRPLSRPRCEPHADP